MKPSGQGRHQPAQQPKLRATLPAATRARTYAGAAALKAYRYPKGVSGNPSGMSRFYFECRRIFQEASPELARAILELALDPKVDERVRSVCLVAGLDRAGVKPIDYGTKAAYPWRWQPGQTGNPGGLSKFYWRPAGRQQRCRGVAGISEGSSDVAALPESAKAAAMSRRCRNQRRNRGRA